MHLITDIDIIFQIYPMQQKCSKIISWMQTIPPASYSGLLTPCFLAIPQRCLLDNMLTKS